MNRKRFHHKAARIRDRAAPIIAVYMQNERERERRGDCVEVMQFVNLAYIESWTIERVKRRDPPSHSSIASVLICGPVVNRLIPHRDKPRPPFIAYATLVTALYYSFPRPSPLKNPPPTEGSYTGMSLCVHVRRVYLTGRNRYYLFAIRLRSSR